jgi:hypothetical protein
MKIINGDSMKIITVLRTSDSYKREYVELLYEQCKKFISHFEFICISDDNKVPGYVKMEHDWPKWWPKMEIFKIRGPALYIDLDTVIVNNIDDILEESQKYDFIAIRDFYKEKDRLERTLQSAILFWKDDMSYLYEEFKKDSVRYMKECTTERWWGDQGFIEKHTKITPSYWQDIIPEKIVSWKVHCKNGVPKNASIIAFHGKPKPWDVKL